MSFYIADKTIYLALLLLRIWYGLFYLFTTNLFSRMIITTEFTEFERLRLVFCFINTRLLLFTITKCNFHNAFTKNHKENDIGRFAFVQLIVRFFPPLILNWRFSIFENFYKRKSFFFSSFFFYLARFFLSIVVFLLFSWWWMILGNHHK